MQSFLAEHKISIKAIFAIDSNSCLGYKNDLLYHNREDLQFFKSKTLNQAVIMGRKTFDSMGKKPLPDRLNIVVTHDPEKERTKFKETKNRGSRRLVFIKDYSEIPHILYQRNVQTGWIIGGKQILTDLVSLTTTFVVTEYMASALTDAIQLGLVDDDDDEEGFDPEKVIRVPMVMKRIRSLPKTKLMPTMIWTSPNGKEVRYTVTSYVRPSPKTIARIADLRAQELMEYNEHEAEKAEADIRQHLKNQRY